MPVAGSDLPAGLWLPPFVRVEAAEVRGGGRGQLLVLDLLRHLKTEWSTLIGRDCRDTVLSLVEIMVLLRQLSYAIKSQLKAPKTTY